MSQTSERPAPAKETGPSEIAAARKLLEHQSSADRGQVLPMRPRWSQALIEGADGPIPPYGSAAWSALSDDSRAKVAATVVAAESWRTYWLPEEIERRLRAELEAVQNHEEPAVWSPEVVASVHRSANRPSFATLSRLRGEPEAEVRANVHRRRMGLPVDERPSTSCRDVPHVWAIFTITTDWPEDASQPQWKRCRRCLLFGSRVAPPRLVTGG